MQPWSARLAAAIYFSCGAIAFGALVWGPPSAAASLSFLVLSLPWSLMLNMLMAIAGVDSPILLRTVLALGIVFNAALIASLGRRADPASSTDTG